MPFAENLALAMSVRRCTNYKLAQDIGVSQSSVANWLAGNTTPRKKMMEIVADYFGTTPEVMSGDSFNVDDVKKKAPSRLGEGIPHREKREVLAASGIRIYLDADAKLTDEQLDDIVDFIRFKQEKNNR